MMYGYGGTIHSSKEVNVELDNKGKVVAVWFRCAALPFTQTVVDAQRAMEMDVMYDKGKYIPDILAMDLTEDYFG